MGWSGGSRVAANFIKTIRREVPDAATRQRIYLDIIDYLEDEDWDTQDEAQGLDPAFDAALKGAEKDAPFDGCEWNPKTNSSTLKSEDSHAPADWLLGKDGDWRLCESCAALPEFKRLKKRKRIEDREKR